MTEKLYAERDVQAQGAYYNSHISAMTAEQLYSKSDIAGELAHRDITIKSLVRVLKTVLDAHDYNGALTMGDAELSPAIRSQVERAIAEVVD